MKITAPIRWTVHNAAREFAIDRRTLEKRLAASNAQPDEAGTYGTQQITAAIYGDLAGEKLRKMRADADVSEMERDRMQEKLMEVEIVEELLGDTVTMLRDRILALDSLDKEARRKLLEVVLRPPPTAADLVAAQRHADNGDFRPIEE